MLEQALRPGARGGPYPERRVRPLEGFDEFVCGSAGFLMRPPRFTKRRADRFVAAVEAGAKELQGLDRLTLDRRLAQIKSGFLRRPLDADLTIGAFALIVEFAARTLGQRPRASQIAGGWAMLHGMVAELETGEGKSLAITLPAATAALAGIPVHVISVNDYLVERDAQAYLPLYTALGLTVGRITAQTGAAQRSAEYSQPLVYCCSKQIVFDYLRDVVSHGAGGTPMRRTLDAARGRGEPLLRGLCFGIVDEADSVLIDECRTPLILSRPARSIHGPQIYAQALQLARALLAGRDYEISAADGSVSLSEAGRAALGQSGAAAGEFWRSAPRRADLVHTALVALHVCRRDEHYLVREGKIQIIDANTGRILSDRSWQLGLHQMIESKEGCALTQPRESIARITYQRFFHRYLRLGATSGTVREVAAELWRVYQLRVYRVPSHRPPQRIDCGRRVHQTTARQQRDVIERVRLLHGGGRPVLIGTRSVAASERLSAALTAAGLEHAVLNARQDRREAEIVARAGMPGRITIATNMAGRGTDIRLTDSVRALGGLHVIATQLNESRRIDRQLFGRCGRQGDPGSYERMLSLEDTLVLESGLGAFAAVIARFSGRFPRAGRLAAGVLASFVQHVTERKCRRVRGLLLRADHRLGAALSFAGPME